MKFRQFVRVACVGLPLALSVWTSPSRAAGTGAPWVTAWATALQAIPQNPALPPLYRAPDVAGRTVRQIVYPTLGGHVVRIHVSNEYGSEPLVIRALSLAPSAGSAGIDAGRLVQVTFGGRPSLSLPPGGEMDSDPARIEIARGQPYALSAYMGEVQRLTGWHRVASQVNYVSLPGNHVDDASGASYAQRFTQYAWVTGFQIEAPGASTVAAIGDSITDGMRSSLDRNRRWPDGLARRLAASGNTSTAVIDLGISGNRLLNDSACYGDALQRRFGHDVVQHPGVRTAILLIGINDINFQATTPRSGLDCDSPHAGVDADDLIAGYRRVIAEAHAHGIRILGATLTPASLPAGREAIRLAANRWIRTGGAFDGVVDFDAALRDAAHPAQLRSEYDSGDHIHPNDAGYAVMADAVPLEALAGR
ncbi:GDSL family lipase [Burkholderia sp. WAC0059]|uniref:SGNH/GDSL hydrolase family protein n=1 Tax=Burkholderia sp. WAC0059 TaxID=2066022 RepID=UPI000C7EAD78|nr:GDSL family lipase [Burkholderia sp. WAC0059]